MMTTFKHRLTIEQRQDKADWVFRLCCRITGCVAILLVFTISFLSYHFGILTVQGWLAEIKPFLAVFRLEMFILILGYWPELIAKLARWGDMDELQIKHALALRWRVAVLMLLIEAVLVHSMLLHLSHWFSIQMGWR